MPKYLIEADAGDKNHDLHWHPTSETLRGRFGVDRVRQEGAFALFAAFPSGIPGQRVEVDTEKGTCAILEPLWEREHMATGVAVLKMVSGGQASLTLDDDGQFAARTLEGKQDANGAAQALFAPARRIVEGAHAPTWLYWAWRAVQSGAAKMVPGSAPLPKDHPDAKKNHGRQMLDDGKDKQIATLTALLLAKLNPAERKQYESMMGQPQA